MKKLPLLYLLGALTPGLVQAEPNHKVVDNFPLSDVKLLDSPFKQAMERNVNYLLELEPDRFLHNTRKYAGLQPKGELYGGWEAQGIAGHSLGHYLTALSLQYASTGDKRFRERIDYIISEMAECQKAYGDGYVGALPAKELATMRGFKDGKVDSDSPFNFKGGAWVPWYTQHKILAGLVDAWVLGKSPQAKDVALKLADWVDDITKGLNPDQQQKMLRVEHGGMLETLVQIYQLTGDKRYLDASQRFYHKAIFDPLLAGKDDLNGKHANTQIPKVIGEARSYEATGDENGRKIAEFFWNTVVHERSWVIGGNSDREHFFPIGKARERMGPINAESCNTYNMLKLTEHLFEWQPTVERGDYYERALYNHILASQEPKHGMFAYFISLRQGHFKTYSTPHDSFWCCVGSGMENHTKYGEAIYFKGDDALYVNLFIPSELTWKEKGLTLEQANNYPTEEFTEFTFKKSPNTALTIRFRCPAWIAEPVTFELNEKPLEVKTAAGQFAEISRVWQKGDRLRMRIPMKLHTESLEGNNNTVAFLYGPLVLAGDFGAAPETQSFPYAKDQGENFRAPSVEVPTLIRKDGDPTLLASVKRLPGKELAFRTEGLGNPTDVTLKPFNTIFYDRYSVYWDVLTASEWKDREVQLTADKEQRKKADARIVDELNFGEQQPEVDHQVTSDKSQIGDFRDRKYRDASSGGYFEFKMKVLANMPQVLRCTYWGGDEMRNFTISIEGKEVATQKLDNMKPGSFVDVEYVIPAELLTGKERITVRLQPKKDSVAGGVYSAAILKAE